MGRKYERFQERISVYQELYFNKIYTWYNKIKNCELEIMETTGYISMCLLFKSFLGFKTILCLEKNCRNCTKGHLYTFPQVHYFLIFYRILFLFHVCSYAHTYILIFTYLQNIIYIQMLTNAYLICCLYANKMEILSLTSWAIEPSLFQILFLILGFIGILSWLDTGYVLECNTL